MENEHIEPEPASGGVDPSSAKDRAAMRTAMTRWPGRFKAIDETKRKFWAEATHAAIKRAHLKAEKYDGVDDIGPPSLGEKTADEKCRLWNKEVLDGVKTALMMDKLNFDEEERARIEAGGVTERLEHTGGVDLDVLVQQRPELRPVIEAMAEEAARQMVEGPAADSP